MNDKKAAEKAAESENVAFAPEEMEELKREMRSAKWVAWMEENKQTLLGAVAGLVVALLIAGYLIENARSARVVAATVYQQALTEQDDDRKKTLLANVSRDFSDSTYGVLALMQLARFDSANAEQHLKALIAHGKAMPEWVWQARLDLAELYLERGDAQAARQQLDAKMGEQYQQLQHYLQAQAASSPAEKQSHLSKALDAPSLDEELKRKIESQLAAKEAS